MAEGEFDVIHAHSAAALALGRLVPDTPLVYTLHHARDPALSEYYRHFAEVAFVAISEDQARREIGARAGRPSSTTGSIRRASAGPSTPGSYVCFIGRLAQREGAACRDRRRAALPACRSAWPARRTPRTASIASTLVEPRLQAPHVTCLGCIGTEQKVPLLRDARALLMPIEWNEPFGLTLIEAMLSGCPVVAFGLGSIPELIEPGVTGFIADSFEDMARLIRPGGAVDRLSRRVIRAAAARRFNHRRMAAEYERSLLRQVAIGGAAAPRGRSPRHEPHRRGACHCRSCRRR